MFAERVVILYHKPMTQLPHEHPLRLAKLLSANKVVFLSEIPSKKELFKNLVRIACPSADSQEIADWAMHICKREESVSTVLNTGLAIPHARIEGLDEFKVALALFENPVIFSENRKIQAMFLFMSPDNPAFFASHLQLLSLVTKTFTHDCIVQLAAAKTPARVVEYFKQKGI